MPHAELKYSSDLKIDANVILKTIEETILSHDTAGACKGRAYPTDLYNHTHILVDISMLTKPHRDKAFTDALIADLEQKIKARIHKSCAFSLMLKYMGDTYVTNMHEV